MSELMNLTFGVLQGSLIFTTALLLFKLLKQPLAISKIFAVSISYVGWSAITIVLYAVAGGGGLMEGGFLLIELLIQAAVSSVIYLALWLILPLLRERRHG